MTDLLLTLFVVGLVTAICAVVLFGIKRAPRLADPPPIYRSDWDDPGD